MAHPVLHYNGPEPYVQFIVTKYQQHVMEKRQSFEIWSLSQMIPFQPFHTTFGTEAYGSVTNGAPIPYVFLLCKHCRSISNMLYVGSQYLSESSGSYGFQTATCLHTEDVHEDQAMQYKEAYGWE